MSNAKRSDPAQLQVHLHRCPACQHKLAIAHPGFGWLRSQDGTFTFPVCVPCLEAIPGDSQIYDAIIVRLENIAREWIAMDALHKRTVAENSEASI